MNGLVFFPQAQQAPIITKFAMISRFTDSEFVDILTQSKTDVVIEAWYVRFNAASQIDLGDVRTQAGLSLLVSKNILTQARADAILSDPVQDNERP